MLSTHSNLLIGAHDLKRKKGPTMNAIIHEVLKDPRKLESPQVRRRLSLALRCRECKKDTGGEHPITCPGCVIEVVKGKRVLNS